MNDDEFAPYDTEWRGFWRVLLSAVVFSVVLIGLLAIAAHSFWRAFSG